MDRQLTREELDVVLRLAVPGRGDDADLDQAACGSLARDGLIELYQGKWRLRAETWRAYRNEVQRPSD